LTKRQVKDQRDSYKEYIIIIYQSSSYKNFDFNKIHIFCCHFTNVLNRLLIYLQGLKNLKLLFL